MHAYYFTNCLVDRPENIRRSVRMYFTLSRSCAISQAQRQMTGKNPDADADAKPMHSLLAVYDFFAISLTSLSIPRSSLPNFVFLVLWYSSLPTSTYFLVNQSVDYLSGCVFTHWTLQLVVVNIACTNILHFLFYALDRSILASVRATNEIATVWSHTRLLI